MKCAIEMFSSSNLRTFFEIKPLPAPVLCCAEKVNPESCDFPIRVRVGPLVDSSNCPATEEHPTLDHHNIITSLFLPSSHHVATRKLSSTEPHTPFLREISSSTNFFTPFLEFFSVFLLIDLSPLTWSP
jgi:hypothetical protein